MTKTKTKTSPSARDVLLEAAHRIETLAYNDICRAIRAASPTDEIYDRAVQVFRSHIHGERPRAWRERHNTAATAAALRAAADGTR